MYISSSPIGLATLLVTLCACTAVEPGNDDPWAQQEDDGYADDGVDPVEDGGFGDEGDGMEPKAEYPSCAPPAGVCSDIAAHHAQGLCADSVAPTLCYCSSDGHALDMVTPCDEPPMAGEE